MLANYTAVIVGGGIGSGLRFMMTNVIDARYGESFPTGTMIVNITGSFLIGLLAAVETSDGQLLLSPPVRHFFLIGILGGYTTFSAFSLQTLHLIRDDRWLAAGAYIGLSVLLCLVGVRLGHALAAVFNR